MMKGIIAEVLRSKLNAGSVSKRYRTVNVIYPYYIVELSYNGLTGMFSARNVVTYMHLTFC